MMFLEGMTPRSHHSTTIKQWSLLLLRTAMISLIAFALARPVLYARAATPPRPGRSAAVMVLDRSASMSLNDNGRRRLDLAKEAIFQLLSPGFKRGDDLWLLALGDGDPASAAVYASDPMELAQHVHDVNSASGAADVASGLNRAIKLLASSDAANREIYLVCDRAAQGWSGVDNQFVQQWTQQARGRVRLFVIPVGSQDTDNVAIESITVSPSPAVVNQPLEVQVRVRNFGSVPRAAVPITVESRDRSGKQEVLSRSTLNLPALGSAKKKISVKLPQAGSIILSASISAAGLATDKRLDYSLQVLDPLRVLIIDGDEGDESSRSASDFLRLALTPFHEAQRNAFLVDVSRPDSWGPADLFSHRVVVLTNVPSLTDLQARSLQQFVYDGGGVIVIPGDQTRVENYNALLPWLPAALQLPMPPSESSGLALQHLNLDHPVLHFLSGYVDVASTVDVRRYFPSLPRVGAAVLADYADGKPFLVTRDVGQGRAVLMTTPADGQWSNLPLTDLFLPLAQSMVRYAAAGPSDAWLVQRNVAIGQPLVASFDEPVALGDLRVVGPAGNVLPKENVSLSSRQDGADVNLASADWPGVYSISAPANPAIQFAVRTPFSESDLMPLSADQFSTLSSRLGFALLDAETQPLALAQESFRRGKELWLSLVAVVIALGMIELAVTGLWAGSRA